MKFRIGAGDSGKRLDHIISSGASGITRSRAKTLIESGLVRVDGVPAPKAGVIMKEGQEVAVTIPPVEPLDLSPRDVGIRILHEDAHLAVLEKPAGLSVHPSHTERGPTVVHGLLHALESLSAVGGVERPGIVHRIDKGTSGILVVSKTDAAHLRLSQAFKTHAIDRRYKALVYGDLTSKGRAGRIETLFARHPTHRKKMTGKTKRGRRAVTNWTLAESLGALTLVECRLETGRTHQIRVHLSELGHPVVGDPLYGDTERRAKALARESPTLSAACLGVKRQLLHAYFLGFEHPATGRRMQFESPLPEEMDAVLRVAREARGG